MRKLSIAILMAAATLCAAALDNNTVTVTATRTLSSQPDQALLYVTLMTPQDVGLDDVLARLKGTGITAADLNSVSPGFGPAIPAGVINPENSVWMFIVTAPLSKLKDTLATLTKLQSSIGPLDGSAALTFSVVGMQSSPESQAAQPCPMPALVADARRHADAMAGAAGMKAGAILSVSDAPLDGFAPIAGPTAVARQGDFTVVGALSNLIISSLQPACSLTVQFKLAP